jgi:hypothetical protein
MDERFDNLNESLHIHPVNDPMGWGGATSGNPLDIFLSAGPSWLSPARTAGQPHGSTNDILSSPVGQDLPDPFPFPIPFFASCIPVWPEPSRGGAHQPEKPDRRRPCWQSLSLSASCPTVFPFSTSTDNHLSARGWTRGGLSCLRSSAPTSPSPNVLPPFAPTSTTISPSTTSPSPLLLLPHSFFLPHAEGSPARDNPY